MTETAQRRIDGSSRAPHIFFSVGEPSGDLHGATLIAELKRHAPDVRCTGFGGPRMAAEGCRLLSNLTELAIMWFALALLYLPRFLGLLKQADHSFRTDRPDCVVLIDYPGFNWWVARRAKKHGIPVIYYGTPQVWAWARWRIKKMRRLTDHVLCKLPFEEAWFRERGCNAHYVGHPYFDHLKNRPLDREWIDHFLRTSQAADNPSRPLVTLLPGSRRQEVKKNLPALLRAAEHIHRGAPQVRFAIASFNTEQQQMAQAIVPTFTASDPGLDVTCCVGRTPELIEAAQCCVACSGSVSLELLYHARPSVIVYTVSRFAYAIQRRFRKVRYITLVNLLASKDIFIDEPFDFDPDVPGAAPVPFPEYLTCRDKSKAMAAHVVRWLNDPVAYRERQQQLMGLRDELLRPDASDGTTSAGTGIVNQAKGEGAAGRAAAYILAAISAEPRSPSAKPQGQAPQGEAHRRSNSSIIRNGS